MPSRSLDDLDHRFQPFSYEFIARAASAGIALLIIGTLRTLEEQRGYVASGASSTMDSRHLAQPPDGKALAMDVCPYDIYQLHGPDKLKWDTSDPVWAQLGAIGEALAAKLALKIRWGGRWKKPHDPGHWELDL